MRFSRLSSINSNLRTVHVRAWSIALTFTLVAALLSPQVVSQAGEIPLVLTWSSADPGLSRSVAWGDYDGDGDLDLVVGRPNRSNLLYRNDGRVLTASAVWSSAEEDITLSVAWGDYDGDGDLDLAVGNDDTPNRLYRNDDGVLTSGAVWSAAQAYHTDSVAWGDYDGDSDLDLAVGNRIDPTMLYRNDDGVLTSSAVWSSVEEDVTHSVAWGDYDSDGDLDLIVGNSSDPSLLYRNENGTLPTSASWSSSEDDVTNSVAWGDYDGDGDLDLAVGNMGYNRLYRNDNGTLNPVWLSTEYYLTSSVAWGDYDGDGDLDLAVGDLKQPNKVYRNDGGTLTASAAWQSIEGDETWSLSAGDFDGDGDLDLAVGNFSEPNRLYCNDSGGLTASAVWSPAEGNGTDVAWGDYDGDGDLDLAVANDAGSNWLYRNDDGSLTTSAIWLSDESDDTQSVAWGDYDGDGDLDLAVGNNGQPSRLYHNDDGSLTTNAIWSSDESDNTYSVAWGDIDGDGDLDLAVGNNGQPNRLYRNDEGTLTTNAVWSSAETDMTYSVAWGDYDGDGDLDLAVGNGEEAFATGQPNRLYRNDGGGLIASAVWSSSEADITLSVAWGDYDGDGDLDLAAGNDDQLNRLYRNDDGILAANAVWSSIEADVTRGVGWGDYDGDGDLDLAVGNRVQPNRLYRNNGAALTTSAIWSSAGSSGSGVAWGDYDGDGNLDLATGNAVYRNLRWDGTPWGNDPPAVTIPRPGLTHSAYFFSTPHVIQAANISITYTLSDPEGDIVARIFSEFSPNGGGQWFPTTAGPGGDGVVNLTTSPNGTSHTFVWNAEADLIRSDNVVFRIRAQSSDNRSPILWSTVDSKSPPSRVAAPWYVKVVDEAGDPITGVTVYADGQPITQTVAGLTVTNQAGLLNPGPLEVGTSLVALVLQAEQSTARDAHDGWAYHTYLTNQPFTVSGPGEQRLVVSRTNPLVLFNLVVSIEWDATDTYLDEIFRAVRYASDYLYDLSDGQMVFGQVNIYDNGAYWGDADVQISTKNIVRPHAYIGGITSEDTSHVIRVGRGWDGNSGNQGPWDQPDGYRTLAHEFGHYALYLYDEYFAYTFDQDGNLTGEVPAYCTGPENRNPATDATNASVMDYQYSTSELSARDVPGLWSDLCEQTAQWQLNGESAWETLARKYADTLNPPNWQFTTPADRGSVLAGPDSLRPDLPDWPLIEVHQEGPSAPPRQLTVYGPQGRYWGAIVALYKQDGRVIGQGFTDSNGRLDIYGATEGDILRVASFDGGLSANGTVSTEMDITLILEPVGGIAAQMAGGIPHMRVVAEPSQDPSQIDLLVFLQNFGPGADPNVLVTEPGSEAGYAPTLSYSPGTDTYEGEISFSATERGMGRIRAVGEVGGDLVRLQSTYRLQQVVNDQSQGVYSNDGNLSLHLDPGSLPGNEAYLVVMPPGAVPGPLPAGLVLLGNPYDVTASGALVTLEKPAVLKLHYDKSLVRSSSAPEGLGIYRWDPISETWQEVPGSLDEEQKAMVASVTTLGTYALLAPPGPWMEPLPNEVFLPIVIKNSE